MMKKRERKHSQFRTKFKLGNSDPEHFRDSQPSCRQTDIHACNPRIIYSLADNSSTFISSHEHFKARSKVIYPESALGERRALTALTFVDRFTYLGHG